MKNILRSPTLAQTAANITFIIPVGQSINHFNVQMTESGTRTTDTATNTTHDATVSDNSEGACGGTSGGE